MPSGNRFAHAFPAADPPGYPYGIPVQYSHGYSYAKVCLYAYSRTVEDTHSIPGCHAHAFPFTNSHHTSHFYTLIYDFADLLSIPSHYRGSAGYAAGRSEIAADSLYI